MPASTFVLNINDQQSVISIPSKFIVQCVPDSSMYCIHICFVERAACVGQPVGFPFPVVFEEHAFLGADVLDRVAVVEGALAVPRVGGEDDVVVGRRDGRLQALVP